MADSCGWADFWSVALNRLGYEAGEIIANAEPMQKRWAMENGFPFSENNWVLEIAAAQVKAFQPEVLFLNDYYTFSAAFLRQLKSECPSIRLVLGWCGAPYPDSTVFHEYDIVLSCIPEMVQHFRENGHRCYHLNHAFEPRVLERIDTNRSPTANFTFIGSIVRQKNFHNEREKLLLDLVKETDLRIWSDLRRSAPQLGGLKMRQLAYDALKTVRHVGVPQSLLTATPLVRKVASWEKRPELADDIDDRIARRADPPLFGVAMFQQLYESRVALNTHIDISPLSASNMRLFEATGVGACLLTDWKPNLPSLFEPDTEVVNYRSNEECVERVRYLLKHEDERRRIAVAGQKRTLQDHIFARRAEELDEIIRNTFRK
ncbi:MAG: glycosyltransferase [Acidobacteriota bacterium]|nr:glycosyltransferase [Acidobacteriota bacterium]